MHKQRIFANSMVRAIVFGLLAGCLFFIPTLIAKLISFNKRPDQACYKELIKLTELVNKHAFLHGGTPPGGLEDIEGVRGVSRCSITMEPYFYGVLGATGQYFVVIADSFPHNDGDCLSFFSEIGTNRYELKMDKKTREWVALLMKGCGIQNANSDVLWNTPISVSVQRD